jgi:hypothetical protein
MEHPVPSEEQVALEGEERRQQERERKRQCRPERMVGGGLHDAAQFWLKGQQLM